MKILAKSSTCTDFGLLLYAAQLGFIQPPETTSSIAMKLSRSEKQALLGPLIVGCLLGGFVAYAFIAFDSELRLSGISVSRVRSVAEAAFGFVLSVVFTVGLLGVLPVMVHRRRAKARSDD